MRSSSHRLRGEIASVLAPCRRYFSGFKQQRVERLTERPRRSRDTEVRKRSAVRDRPVSRRSSPAEPDASARTWTVAQKARVLTEAAGLKGVSL